MTHQRLKRTHCRPLGCLSPSRATIIMKADLYPGTPSLQRDTDTVSYCGPFEYRNGTLSRVNFPGGFVKDDSVYHCIHDHQGNVRQVVNAATGYVAQENHYYPGACSSARAPHSVSPAALLLPLLRRKPRDVHRPDRAKHKGCR